MTTAITPLATLTLSSTATSVTFSSISQSYKDLYLVINYGNSSVGELVYYQLNSDTNNGNYGGVYMVSSATASGYFPNYSLDPAGVANATLSAHILANFMDYSATDKHKSQLIRVGGQYGTLAAISRWANNSAITSIKILPSAGSFLSGSTFSLYGVSA